MTDNNELTKLRLFADYLEGEGLEEISKMINQFLDDYFKIQCEKFTAKIKEQQIESD